MKEKTIKYRSDVDKIEGFIYYTLAEKLGEIIDSEK